MNERKKRTYGPGYSQSPENTAFCVEAVYTEGRAPSGYQCQRKRGHGTDGLYCKQHAKVHGQVETMTLYDVYVERNLSLLNEAVLDEVQAIESPKQFTIPKTTRAYGYSRRVPRDEAYLSPGEAIQAALKKREKSIAATQLKLDRLKKEIRLIEALKGSKNVQF